MLRFLLLSDIHFLSLCEEVDPHAVLRRAFLKDVEDYRMANGPIDCILVSGDIAFKGDKDEYEAAHKFFEKLCNAVDCKPEQVYIVPGNHDKNFSTPNESIRHLINAGLSSEKIDSDRLFINLLGTDFSKFKDLYQPFKDYQDFAVKMVSTEPLMTKCLDDGEGVVYNNDEDKAYMVTVLGYLGDYPVILYAMNTSLCSDWYDIDDFGNGHKLFLSQLSYCTSACNEGNVNIVMMHHPTSKLVRGEEIERVLDENFQVQIFGHLHQPASNNNGVVHIHSGALQPQQNENDKSDGYFSVYNILELNVLNNGNVDNLSVGLKVAQFDKGKKVFNDNTFESKNFILPLKKHNNRFLKESQVQVDVLPDGISERTVKYKFLQLDNPKSIMRQMHHQYDENKSYNKNCIEFLNNVQSEDRLLELWNLINR